MKKLLLNISFLIFVSNFFLLSKVFSIDNSYNSPILIFNNPAKMASEIGMPIGLEIKLSSLDSINVENIHFRSGISYQFSKKAFLLGFESINKDVNILSTGFAQNVLISSFGAALKIEYSKKLLPNIDVSYIFRVNKSLSFNAVIKNIYTQYRSNYLHPEVNIYINGELNRLHFELGYLGTFYDYSKFAPSNCLQMCISYEFLKNDLLFTSLENTVYQNENDEIITELGISLGFKIRIQKTLNGISTGYQHNVKSSKGQLVNNLLINPTYYNDINPPECNVTYECSQNVDNELLFNIDCVDKNGSVKKWSLIITEKTNSKKIIKSFSGGNIPPKLIMWDFKDTFGNVYNNSILNAQLVVSDKSKNYSVSKIVAINPCNRK